MAQPLQKMFDRTLGGMDENGPSAWQKFKSGLGRTFQPFHELVGEEPIGPGGQSKSEFYNPSRDAGRRLKIAARVANQQALTQMNEIVGPKQLKGPEDYQLFLHKLWTDELATTSGSGDAFSMPGFTRQEANAYATQEQARLQPFLDQKPNVQQAVQKLFDMHRDIRDQLVERNLLPEDTRDTYMHHQVMEFIRGAYDGRGVGERLPNLERELGTPASPPGQSFSNPTALQERTRAGVGDINRDFLQVEYKYLRSVLSAIKTHDAMMDIVKNTDLRTNPKAGFEKAQDTYLKTGMVPKGYQAYDLRSGFTRLMGNNASEDLLGEQVDTYAPQLLEAFGIPKERLPMLISQLLPDAKTVSPNVAVIPDEVANTLHEIAADRKAVTVPSIIAKGTNFWKTVVLLKDPIYYNVHNTYGDIQRMIAQYGPTSPFNLRNWGWSFNEVKNAYSGQPTDLWNWAHDNNVVRSGRTAVESTELQQAPQFAHLQEGAISARRGINAITNLFGLLPKYTTMREDMMRMYLLKMNMDRIAGGQPLLTGVADTRGLEGLDPRQLADHTGQQWKVDKASANVAREGLFDYADFTGRENSMRNGLLPFYGWASKDLRFWGSMVKGVATGKVPGGGAATAAAMRGFGAVVGISMAARIWNSYKMGDAEEQLPRYVQNSNHIILPDMQHFTQTGQLRPWVTTDANGQKRIAYIRMTDAADDALSWIGMDGAAPDLKLVLDGKMSPREYLTRRGEDAIFRDGVPLPATANKLTQLLGPEVQVPANLMGYKVFPQIGPIGPGDKTSQVLNSLGLGGVPGTEFAGGPPSRSVFPPTPQTFGENTAVTGGVPTYIQEQLQATRKVEGNLRDLRRQIERLGGGASSPNLMPGPRSQRVQELMQTYQRMLTEYEDRAQRLQTLLRSSQFSH